MTGGGSLLYGLDRLLTERCKVPCYVAEDAVSCVAIGTGKALESLDAYSAVNSVYDYKEAITSVLIDVKIKFWHRSLCQNFNSLK